MDSIIDDVPGGDIEGANDSSPKGTNQNCPACWLVVGSVGSILHLLLCWCYRTVQYFQRFAAIRLKKIHRVNKIKTDDHDEVTSLRSCSNGPCWQQ